MEYSYSVPQKSDRHDASQDDFLNNFRSLNGQYSQNHIPLGNTVEDATRAAPCVITSTNHSLSTGDTVSFTHVQGLQQQDVYNLWNINTGGPYSITKIDDNHFSVDGTNTTTQDPYVLNTGDWNSSAIPYGDHKLLSFPEPVSVVRSPPILDVPKAALFPNLIDNDSQNPDLAWQNFLNPSFIDQITGFQLLGSSTSGQCFRTPWGFNICMGVVQARLFILTPETVVYPVPFTINPYCLVGSVLGGSQVLTLSFLPTVSPTTQFQILGSVGASSPPNVSVFYMAIGI